MRWTGYSFDHGLPYWDAPFFHPHHGVFAWSEPQPATGLVVWLLSNVVDWVMAYNLCVLVFLIGFGAVGYLMVRQLTHDRVAALWSAIWLTGGAYVIEQLGVLHLLAAFAPALCLTMILSQLRAYRPWKTWLAGAAYFLTFVTCAQYGLFLSILLPCVLAPHVKWLRTSRAHLLHIILPLIIGALSALPFLLAQRHQLSQMGFERSLINVRGVFLARDLFISAKGHWLTSDLLSWREQPDIYSWDIGVVPLLCIGLALALRTYRARRAESGIATIRRCTIAFVLLALVLGFGPRLAIDIQGRPIGLYHLLHAYVPGFDGVRSPARFAVFVTFGVATLGGEALAMLRSGARRPIARHGLTAIFFLLLFAEMWAAPVALTNPLDDEAKHGPVIAWLKEHGGGEPLLEWPMAAGDDVSELEVEVRVMLRALEHGHPIGNGYSGYFPEPYRQIRQAIHEHHWEKSNHYLRALGIRFLLVHHQRSGPPLAHDPGQALGTERVVSTDDETLYRLPERRISDGAIRYSTTAPLSTEPRVGDIVRIPLEKPPDQAALLYPRDGESVQIRYPGPNGGASSLNLRLRGSVLLDKNDQWIHLQIVDIGLSAGEGEGALISTERVESEMSRRRSGPKRP